MKQVIKLYDKFADEGNFLSEYINVLAIKQPQGEEAKKGTKAEVKALCGSIIGKVKRIEKLLLEQIGE